MHSKPGSDTSRRNLKFIVWPRPILMLASIDPQIAFANEVVAAMKNRLAEGRAMFGMRQGELS